MNWENKRFIDFIQLQRGHDLTKEQFVYGPYPVVSSTSVIGYHNEYKAKGPGIVIGRSGTLGKVQYIHENYWPHNTALYVKDYKNNYPKFVYYFLTNFATDKHGGGAAVPTLNRNSLSDILIKVPDINTQRQIANILSAYDDLIENNQKQIKLLEEAVMRLYKEWFVNLRFPGYETVKIVDGVPEGWKRSTFKSLCELIKDSIKLGHINDDISYIGLEHIPRKSICLNKWGSSSDVNSDKYRYQKKDILFGKIRPYFHKVGFAINDGVCSTDAMVFRAKENYFGLLLTTAFSDEFVANSYATCREGAKMPRADWNEMGNYPVLIPHGKTLLVFNSITNDFFDLITNKHKQNHNLSEARDKLLPKLMNGEIDIPEE